eukprot:6741813-Alexandrium_andersonii.AAC.1
MDVDGPARRVLGGGECGRMPRGRVAAPKSARPRARAPRRPMPERTRGREPTTSTHDHNCHHGTA